MGQEVYENYVNNFSKKKNVLRDKLSILGPKMIYPRNSVFSPCSRKLFYYNVILRGNKNHAAMILNGFNPLPKLKQEFSRKQAIYNFNMPFPLLLFLFSWEF